MRSKLLLACVLACLALSVVSALSVSKRGHATGSLALQSESAADVMGCTDVKPKGSEQYSCQQQKAWGKCSASWMHGFCKKTCGKCSAAAPSHHSSSPSHSSSSSSSSHHNSLKDLGIKTSSLHSSIPIHHYDSKYAANKVRIVKALRGAGLSESHVRLLLAIAMLETNTFDPASRDKKKTGDSTNYSAFNINRDMLRRLGVGNMESLNSWNGLGATVRALKSAVSTFGVNGFLNYHRGGYTGWKDAASYGCQGYRNGIASMVKQFDENPALMSDDRRLDLVVRHV